MLVNLPSRHKDKSIVKMRQNNKPYNKPYVLNKIFNKFRKGKFVKSEFKEIFRNEYNNNQISGFLRRYVHSSWLSSNRIKKGLTNKDSRVYQLSSKALKYREIYGGWFVGPLVESKEPETIIKEVPKETKYTREEQVTDII